ncbi:MAG: hypothetical protein V5A68_01880 [Candidatus Thermoplasmatota archaeon]
MKLYIETGDTLGKRPKPGVNSMKRGDLSIWEKLRNKRIARKSAPW